MKSIFPLLLTYVLMTSQTFAISGGPVFPGGGVTVTGIYSGVLQGVTETSGGTVSGPAIPGDPLPPGDSPSAGTPSNAIGLFDLTIPQTTLATGTFLLFADGVVFGGTIDASGDIDSGLVQGILQGSYNFSLQTFNSTGDAVSTAITAQALGTITAEVRNPTANFATSLARLIGTAELGVNFGQVDPQTFAPIVSRTITFDVSGFKQSN